MKTKVLLIDDDPVFRMTMKAAGEKNGLEVTACGSLAELKLMDAQSQYDVAVLDYYLDDLKDFMTGIDVARGFGATPVLLVSSNLGCVENTEDWPTSVRKFANKRVGADVITALAASLNRRKLQE